MKSVFVVAHSTLNSSLNLALNLILNSISNLTLTSKPQTQFISLLTENNSSRDYPAGEKTDNRNPAADT